MAPPKNSYARIHQRYLDTQAPKLRKQFKKLETPQERRAFAARAREKYQRFMAQHVYREFFGNAVAADFKRLHAAQKELARMAQNKRYPDIQKIAQDKLAVINGVIEGTKKEAREHHAQFLKIYKVRNPNAKKGKG